MKTIQIHPLSLLFGVALTALAGAVYQSVCNFDEARARGVSSTRLVQSELV